MDLTTAAAPPNDTTKPPEAEAAELPTKIPPPSKSLPYANGVLKRHQPHQAVVVFYKECLKNHAASLGRHAVDGCGEFMPSPSATPTDPTSLKCSACGCHRNFHRREPDEPPPTTHVIEYQPHHRHHPPPPPPPSNRQQSPDSPSPPPISSSYYPSAPHMLLALSGGLSAPPPENAIPPPPNNTPPSTAGRKRFRTKFSPGQKEKMYCFAERVGWKMQKSDEDLVAQFCSEVGVDRGVLKVWMHNNKHAFAKRESNGTSRNENEEIQEQNPHSDPSPNVITTTNGSSSSC